jgi:putative membrane protein
MRTVLGRRGVFSRRVEGADVLKGAVAGLAGGLLASWAMGLFMTVVKKATQSCERSREASLKEEEPREEFGRQSGHERSGQAQEGGGEENPTVKVATIVSENVFRQPLPEDKKQAAGTAVHYGFGGILGAIYGGAAEVAPEVTVCAGTGYGAAVWLGADEIAVPALKLSKPPQEHPLSVHIGSLAAHLVYGLTLEGTRQAIRSVL